MWWDEDMKKIIAGLLFVIGSCMGTASGAETWTVKSYMCPGDLLSEGLVVEGKGRLKLPNEPGEDAESVRAFIQQSSLIFAEYLKDLPQGSLVVLDKKRHTLAARTTVEGHGVIEAMLEEVRIHVPKMLAFQVDLLETSTTDLNALLEEVAGNSDHSAVLGRLEKAGARVVASGSFETKSGQRVKTSMVTNMSYVSEFAARTDGSSEGTTREVEPVGLEVEIDPVVGYDGRTLDLNLAVRHTTQAGAPRLVPLGTLAGKRVEGGMQDFVTENWTTATTLLSGQSRMLGVAPAEEAGKARLCFLTAAAPVVMARKSTNAENWLKAHGDVVAKALTGPKKETPTLGLMSGMIVKKFHVPPDFLSAGAGGAAAAPADPFSASAPEPTFMVRMTVQDILKAEGIPFPDGSSATFDRTTSTLTVVNLPANMAKVEDYINSIITSRPAHIQLHLHVVEAASGTVRKLARESLGVTDHRAAWEALQAEITADRGRLVGVAAVETKSGQRCTVESGRQYAWANANLKAQVPEAKDEKRAVVVTGVPVAELVATVEREPLGLRWEVDPVLGADGYTLDVNMSVRHHSQTPTERFEAAAAREGVLTVDAPAVDFHPMELTTAFTTQNGMWRMIGTWQPVGADGGLDPDVMQAVFVRATVVRVE